MILSPAQIDALAAQALRDAPNETCGLIAGEGERAVKLFPLPNTDPTPRVRYQAEPHALLAALQELEARNWTLLAIYHSHPTSPAYPSPTDLEQAYYPEAVYVLISLENPDVEQVRAFRIENGQVREVTVRVEPEERPPRSPNSGERTSREAGRRPGRPSNTGGAVETNRKEKE